MWILNLYLYIAFMSNQAEYQALKSAGYACYVNTDVITGSYSLDRPPACWYDPQESGRSKADSK